MSQSKNIKLGVRLMVGIPTLKSSPRTVEWTDAMASLQMPLGSSMGREWTKDETIADARNSLCKAAIDSGAEYLFMLGDDVIPPGNTLLALLDRIGREYPVSENRGPMMPVRASMITGVYWTKAYPPEPYLFNGLLEGSFKDWIAGEFLSVDMAGCDCLLIETEMLKAIPFPWFSTDWVWEEGQKPSSIATEDFYFYTKAREYGFRLFADTSIQCLHQDRNTGAAFGLSMDMVQAGGVPKVGKDKVLVADLGAGLYTPTALFGPGATITRFDMREDTNPDIRCDIRSIDPRWFGIYDFVSSHHTLEHFRRREAPDLIKHWVQLLKVGGQLHIYVPNLERAMRLILDPKSFGASAADQNYAWAQIFGDQAEPGAPWQHLNGFTKAKLAGLLRVVPELSDITIEEQNDGLNLMATAILSRELKPYALTSAWKRIKKQETKSKRVKVKGD